MIPACPRCGSLDRVKPFALHDRITDQTDRALHCSECEFAFTDDTCPTPLVADWIKDWNEATEAL